MMKLIDTSRLSDLLLAEAILIALERGGVDNWEWHSESINQHAPHVWKWLGSEAEANALAKFKDAS